MKQPDQSKYQKPGSPAQPNKPQQGGGFPEKKQNPQWPEKGPKK